ncbi:unnamed protein product, partial [marine sediment metagenome]
MLMGTIACNNTFVSQSIGRGDPKEAGRYTIHAIYFAIIYQLLLLPLMAWTDEIFRLYPHKPELSILGAQYLRMRIPHLAATGAVMACATFFQGSGRARIPMIAGILANLLNVFGDWVLIFGKGGLPRMGISGAGLATTLSTYVEAGMLLAVFVSWRMHQRYDTRRWLPFEWRRLRQLIGIGMPSGLHWMLNLGSWAVFVNVIVGKLGTDVSAGNTAASQIMHLSFMPTIGLNIGVTALVGRHIGAKN